MSFPLTLGWVQFPVSWWWVAHHSPSALNPHLACPDPFLWLVKPSVSLTSKFGLFDFLRLIPTCPGPTGVIIDKGEVKIGRWSLRPDAADSVSAKGAPDEGLISLSLFWEPGLP
ncbi:hypothetical protein TNCV_1212001 [Trichonephila clavipes]|nr:hypothetical protein TNCV_1212001 [Trichonephila clavipes]